MHIRSLNHLLEIVKALLHPERILVLGSSSLLATAPELGEPGRPLELSLDADLLVEPCGEAEAAVVHEAIGEGSLFHREHGFYVDLLRPSITETFAPGWRERCVPLGSGVFCLNPLDLAFVKLCLGREKDCAVLHELVMCGMIRPEELRRLYQSAPLDEATMFKAGRILGKLEA